MILGSVLHPRVATVLNLEDSTLSVFSIGFYFGEKKWLGFGALRLGTKGSVGVVRVSVLELLLVTLRLSLHTYSLFLIPWCASLDLFWMVEISGSQPVGHA